MEFKFRRNRSRNDPDRMPQEQDGKESLFVDDAQIERWQTPTLDLGVINKQHQSFSTTTILHNDCPPCPTPSPMATTNPDPEQPDTAHDKHGTPKNSKNNAATPHHHPQLAKERLQDRKHSATSPTAMWRPNDEQQPQSSFVVFVLSEYSMPVPLTM